MRKLPAVVTVVVVAIATAHPFQVTVPLVSVNEGVNNSEVLPNGLNNALRAKHKKWHGHPIARIC